jgi:hypothetical protein
MTGDKNACRIVGGEIFLKWLILTSYGGIIILKKESLWVFLVRISEKKVLA